MKVVFRKSDHEHVRRLLKALHWLPVKERIVFKIATFVFSISDGPGLSVAVQTKTTVSCANLGLCFPLVLWSGSPCPEHPSCSHPTLQFSLTVHNLKPFSLLPPTLTCSSPLTGTECCTDLKKKKIYL